MGKVKTSATSRASTITLAADPDLAGTIATASSQWLVDIGIRVSGAEGHGGVRFNLRFPAGAVAFLFRPWQWSDFNTYNCPVLVIPESGINQNIGASAADYFMLDNGGVAFSGILCCTVAFQINATTGAVSFEWAQARSSVVPTIVGVGSAFSARNP